MARTHRAYPPEFRHRQLPGPGAGGDGTFSGVGTGERRALAPGRRGHRFRAGARNTSSLCHFTYISSGSPASSCGVLTGLPW